LVAPRRKFVEPLERRDSVPAFMRRRVLVVVSLAVLTILGCGDDAQQQPGPDAGIDAPIEDTGEIVCEQLPPLASGTCGVTDGNDKRLIKGNILTPQTVFRGGQVAIDEAGMITCVGCNCAEGGETTIVCPQASVSPGLINTHDHITFTHNDPYTDVGVRYEHRHQWRRGQDGKPRITASGGASGDRISFGELRFLLGGTTSIVGSGGRPGLLRNLDSATQQEGLNRTPVEFETFPLGDSNGTRRTADCNYGTIVTPESLVNVKAFEPHTSEGTDLSAHNEFKCQSSDTYDTTEPGLSQNLLLPKTALIHAIGLTAPDYAAMAIAGTALIWSPRSNITLYGDTARVTTAAAFGVEIALGTDWMPTGSMNMLRELRCADDYNRTYLKRYFTDKQLWEMVTLNAAAVTATDDAIGLLAPGHVADIAIFATHGRGHHRAIIEAEPKDVALVLRGGVALYGDDQTIAGLTNSCDTLDVCGVGKRVCVKRELGKTWSELLEAVGTIYPAFTCGTPPNEPTCTPKRPAAVNGSTVFTGAITADDSDGDGINDGIDNCPTVFNPIRPMDNNMQGDADGDGEGDACDVCPLDPGMTTCTMINPNDRDRDGVVNSADNCPDVPNPQQTDSDMDGKGDACDPCPNDPNPGTAGCPVPIYSIKQGLIPNGTVVRVVDALVTGKGSNGFFVQRKVGDPGYAGAEYSGLFVYTGAMSTQLANAVVGMRVTIDGRVATFQGQLELDTVSAVIPTTMTAEAPPVAVVATYAEVKNGGSKQMALESVLVQLGAATVTATNPTYGEFTLTAGSDTLIVDDFLYLTPNPAVGMTITSITGILALRQASSKLEPRSASDIVQGAPALASFGPALSYARQGTSGVHTFPAGSELTVTLSGPAQGNTDVTLTSSSSAITIPGGKVTIASGESSARVVLDAVQQNAAVTITAQLGSGTPLTAQVRVLGTNEQPTAVTLAPSTASVAPGGTVTLTVTTNIPAPAGGTSIGLAVSPGGAGTTNPATTVVVPQDTMSATVDYTDATGGAATVTATLGGSTSSTQVSVVAGANNLVINEVDYDQIGTDNAEYIEIFNPTGAAINLNNVAVVLINGATNLAYPTATSTIDLSSLGSLPAGGYVVIAGANIAVPAGVLKLDPGWTTDAIQNGSPDGIALVDTATNTLIDALSYEGPITMAEVPGIANPVSLVEGTVLANTVADSNTAVGSLCRSPNGKDTNNANADWKFCTTLTPGSANP
jgi:large repetitive protein